jgi:SHS2 domain-containing protein
MNVAKNPITAIIKTMKKPYETIDHTADMAIRVHGDSRENLFENAGYALFDSLVELSGVHDRIQEKISVTGTDLPELMVNWLNQLLFLWETRFLLLRRFSMETMGEQDLTAWGWGETYDSNRHEILTDIKAATYHNLTIQEKEGLWTAEIVLDL